MTFNTIYTLWSNHRHNIELNYSDRKLEPNTGAVCSKN